MGPRTNPRIAEEKSLEMGMRPRLPLKWSQQFLSEVSLWDLVSYLGALSLQRLVSVGGPVLSLGNCRGGWVELSSWGPPLTMNSGAAHPSLQFRPPLFRELPKSLGGV